MTTKEVKEIKESIKKSGFLLKSMNLLTLIPNVPYIKLRPE